MVERAEVSLWGDERLATAEVLTHTDQRLVDGSVAMGVILAHRVANDTGAFAEVAVRADALLQHRIQDSALHWL